MERVFVIYNLKKEVSIEDYKKWSREVDQMITPNQPGVLSFEVFEILGAEQDSAVYQIVECIDVESWDVWQKVLKSEGMKKVVSDWDNYGEGKVLIMMFGRKIQK